MIRPETYVYVAAAQNGWHKIGRTINLKLRMYHLGRDRGFERVSLVHSVALGDDAPEVENMAHWLLADSENHREWFNVDVEAAIDAIQRAIGKVANGERCKEKFSVAKRLNVRDGLNAQIQAAMVHGETRQRFLEAAVRNEIARRLEPQSAFIREAVERELERRKG